MSIVEKASMLPHSAELDVTRKDDCRAAYMLASADGSVPVSELPAISRACRFVSSASVLGSVPVIPSDASSSVVRPVRPPTAGSRGLLKFHWLMDSSVTTPLVHFTPFQELSHGLRDAHELRKSKPFQVALMIHRAFLSPTGSADTASKNTG